MANIPIRDIPGAVVASPDPSNLIPMDNGSIMQKTTIANAVNTTLPLSSQAEAEAGVDNVKRMSSLRTKQAIDAQTPAIVNVAITSLNLGTMSQEEASDYTPTSGLAAVALSNDYDDLDNLPTLGTAAATDATDYATAAQGAAADTAVQPSDLAAVATSGDYDDLSNKPTLGTMAAETASDYTKTTGLGGLALKDKVSISDIDATGTADNTTFLRGDGTWSAAAGGSVDALFTEYLGKTPEEQAQARANLSAQINLYTVTPEEFGALGDGVEDDAQAIQDAIDELASRGGGILHMRPGATYKISFAPAITTDNIQVKGNGATIDGSGQSAVTTLNTVFGFVIQGSLAGSGTTLSANAAVGDMTISVASTSGLAVDDIILLDSVNGKWPPQGTSRAGGLYRIRSVNSGTSLTLHHGLIMPFTASDTVNVTKVNALKGIVIDGLKLVMGGKNKTHNGFKLAYAVQPLVRNCSVYGAEDCGIRTEYLFGGGIYGGDWSYSQSPAAGSSGSTGNTGYGVVVGSGCRDITVEGANFRECRHAIAGGGTHPAVFVNISNNHVDGGRIDPSPAYDIECHEDCMYWTFSKNVVVGGLGENDCGGMMVRGRGCTIEGNYVINSRQYGIQVHNFDADDTEGVRFTKVVNNTVLGSRLSGIYLRSDAGRTNLYALIEGNIVQDIKGSGSACITVSYSDRVSINNNILGATGAVDVFGIRLLNSNNISVCGNNASGGGATSTSSAGVSIEDTNDVVISGNLLRTFHRPVRTTGTCNYIVYTGNNGRNNLNGASITASSKVEANNL